MSLLAALGITYAVSVGFFLALFIVAAALNEWDEHRERKAKKRTDRKFARIIHPVALTKRPKYDRMYR